MRPRQKLSRMIRQLREKRKMSQLELARSQGWRKAISPAGMTAVDREQLRRDCSDALHAIQQDQDVPGLEGFPARLRELEPTYQYHAPIAALRARRRLAALGLPGTARAEPDQHPYRANRIVQPQRKVIR
jgi:transcriptional regulator with XRE-family HTH domain